MTSEISFFTQPIINSPYEYPSRHWELDAQGQPTNRFIDRRRRAEFVTPVPKPQKGASNQMEFEFKDSARVSTEKQKYDPIPIINELRAQVDQWRELPNTRDWNVTPETARLLQHWRSHRYGGIRPFFCQVEAIETLIWLTEVAPRFGRRGKAFLDHLDKANSGSELSRLALKLATGAGKTTVMAMIVAWQTINAVRHPQGRYTRGFLVVAPGLTIRDRLRVLQPSDPDSYFRNRQLVPTDLLADIDRARIVITNYHAFKRRETLELSKGGRALLQGRSDDRIQSLETDGQMLRRVMPELMGMKNLMVLNDEAHHCYREKPQGDEDSLVGDERKEAERNREAARVWMSGLETVAATLGLRRVVDLSATPFFLRGSGYVEGTLFPWTMSDFSLMDAIECGIVKLPRVPVADNVPGGETPMFRNLWDRIGRKMPKKGRVNAGPLDPLSIPTELQTALEALYGHYEKTFENWSEADVEVPPCFIVVCNNTSTSKLIFDYISGWKNENGTVNQGRLELFRNFDKVGNPLPRPNTLLIDSKQLESGETLDTKFREFATDEIERFRREVVVRTGDPRKAENLTDEELLREAMNTVGKAEQLGGSIRCVVSVSMLTEGWDANTVTHILGVRAFGTQLLCEQVIGRALRRQSYDLNDKGRFNAEYADVFGIPFDFTAKPVVVPPQPPRQTTHVHAIIPDRDACEIRFPRVEGYRVELPDDRLSAEFNEDSTLVLTPELTGPAKTVNQGIVGEGSELTLAHTKDVRSQEIVYELTKRLLETKWRDEEGEPKLHMFGQLKRITRKWLDSHLECKGGTYPAQILYQELKEIACERIARGIIKKSREDGLIKVLLDPFNPVGSTSEVNFRTSNELKWRTKPARSHVNFAICDSTWEMEFCRVAEAHPLVRAYVKNDNLGFEVPYHLGSQTRRYIPDFIVLVDDGHGKNDLLHLVVEIKGYRGEDAKEKKATMETCWVPGVNQLNAYGRWAFAEFCDVHSMEAEFGAKIEKEFHKFVESATHLGEVVANGAGAE